MAQQTKYIAPENLQAACNVALDLQMPLLVTGEPGTGKTQLAYWLAEQKNTEVLRFNTKTTSVARDLQFDSRKPCGNRGDHPEHERRTHWEPATTWLPHSASDWRPVTSRSPWAPRARCSQ